MLANILPIPKFWLNFNFQTLFVKKSWYDSSSEILKWFPHSSGQEVLQDQELHAYWFVLVKVGEREAIVARGGTVEDETISASCR